MPLSPSNAPTVSTKTASSPCPWCGEFYLLSSLYSISCVWWFRDEFARRPQGTQINPLVLRHEIDPTTVTDGNEDSPAVDGNGRHFYCAKCMHVVPCACIRRSFTSCAHDFCSSCVSRRLRGRRGDGKHFYCTKCMHVVPCACIRPSFTSCAHDFCSSCVARPTSQRQGLRRRAGKMPQHQPADLVPVDMLLLTEGNGDSPVYGHGELFDCAICMETVPGTLKFSVNSCGHAFCSSCVTQYVVLKLDDKVALIECPHPGCEGGTIEPESCHGIIPTDLHDKWGLLLCELAVGAKRIYCPYLECSALLLTDGEAGAAAIAEAECGRRQEDILPVPRVLGALAHRRLFCARCAVPWHDGFGCEEFQKLGQDERGREDLLLRRLVGMEGWQRCPKCQMFVEKSEGCNYIKCRYVKSIILRSPCGTTASGARSSRSSGRTSAAGRTSCSGVSSAWRAGSGAPSARCSWRNRKGAITSNAGVDTASATDAHPSCPRKTITATSACANNDLVGYGYSFLPPSRPHEFISVMFPQAFINSVLLKYIYI
uniref:Putative E3 ubiquitin-protein ligase n=1 Tax=Aegilops tauschii TaxID=37682 RepID=M8CBB7_AEGTA